MDWFLCDNGLRHERVNKKISKVTRNDVHCNGHDNLANLSFILNVSVFPEAHLKPKISLNKSLESDKMP